jgi:hypothetical protein
MSLRLQLKGCLIRWATYSKGGFKGGVSLTCDDGLNRRMKCAYGNAPFYLVFDASLINVSCNQDVASKNRLLSLRYGA